MKTSDQDRPLIKQEMQDRVFNALSERLKTIENSPNQMDTLEARIFDRIQKSVAQHDGLRVIRTRTGTWRNLIAGIRYKMLWLGSEGNSVMIEFAPGAALPVHRHSHLEEGIVLSGSLQMDELVLRPFDYHISSPGSHHGRIFSDEGGIAFLRGSSIGSKTAMFKEVAGGFFAKTKQASTSIHSEDGWIKIKDDCSKKDLWSDGVFCSKFYHLAANGSLETKKQIADGELMLLSGELFVGDILLQKGDYLTLLKGNRPLDIMTDTGAIFYLRVATDS